MCLAAHTSVFYTSTLPNQEHSKGGAHKDALRVEFGSRIKLEFHGTAVMSDAGLIAYREREAI